MKIAFVGDSFCVNAWPKTQDHPDQECWPVIVATDLDAEIIQLGNGGQHFYHAASDFMLNILDADITIMCVSEPYRVINRWGLPINMVFVDQMMDKTGQHWKNHHKLADQHGIPVNKMLEIAKAAEGYYKHLYDETVTEFLQIGLISFIDGLLKSHNKKVIWFPCFQQSFSLPREYWQSGNSDTDKFYDKIANAMYIPTSGPSANMPLFDISMAELVQEGLTPKEREYVAKNDERNNHLNSENNIHMARSIIDVIRSDNFTPRELKLEEYFLQLNLDKVKRMR
jgi:hypothetical protein